MAETKLRNTIYRKALLNLFSEEGSFSVPLLLEKLAALNLFPNKTTLYREIETLRKEGIIELVPSGNNTATMYKGVRKAGHYHHLICEKCTTVVDVEVPAVESALYQAEQDLGKTAKFTVSGHSLTFSGTCQSCQQIK